MRFVESCPSRTLPMRSMVPAARAGGRRAFHLGGRYRDLTNSMRTIGDLLGVPHEITDNLLH